MSTTWLGRSHRASGPKARLALAISRSARLLDLPSDWRLGIVPGSDTGAFEMAMWSLLGPRSVDALVWESFSKDWANDLRALQLPGLNVLEGAYGELPGLDAVRADSDVVFVYNGTTSGVRLPDLDWLHSGREGLALCDATSAAYAMPLDFTRLDVVTWSWQKGLGGEGAHGMLALSPRAVERLESMPEQRPLPKLFTLSKGGELIEGIFEGATINTPSLLAVEDLHSALDWADRIGGLGALHQRTADNQAALDEWVSRTAWVDWLAREPSTRSPSSMCLSITDPAFNARPLDERQRHVKSMATTLDDEGVAFDIANYRSAPPGFRIWGGPTVDAEDIRALTPWLDWAYAQVQPDVDRKTQRHD